MKKQLHVLMMLVIVTSMMLTSCSKRDDGELTQKTTGSTLKSATIAALPAYNDNRVAYYVFDVTTAGQAILPLTTFTDNANIVIVFEGTLWELADTVHYNSGWMQNAYYKNKKQVLNDIQTLRARGIKVLMNVDDAASWSTATPFTTYNGTSYNYQQFASFVYNCVTKVGLDGISLDVEHGATDNTNYRNLIKEFGKYFGPLSPNSTTQIYTGAFYSGGAPGPIFRETSLSQYLNFVMDMAYFSDNTTRFNYWATTLGNSKVMDGMSYDDNSQSSAITHTQWHPTPDKAGIMVFAANKNKVYTDAIFAALSGCAPTALTPYVMVNGGSWQQTSITSLSAGGTVVLGPGPNTGTWFWIGPNNFNATTREITFSNIQTNHAGNYVATNTNSCGAQSSLTFTISINGSGTGKDITNLGGTITAQYTDSPSGEDITKLIDNSSATKYLTSHSSGWVRYYSSTGSVVVKYTITSANDVPARDPKNWTLQGSNNGTSWTTLDTRTSQSFASRFLTKTYTFTNTTSYTYYRLNVTAVQSGSIMQMAEWELWTN